MALSVECDSLVRLRGVPGLSLSLTRGVGLEPDLRGERGAAFGEGERGECAPAAGPAALCRRGARDDSATPGGDRP